MNIIEKIKEMDKAQMSYYQRWTDLMAFIESNNGVVVESLEGSLEVVDKIESAVSKRKSKIEKKPVEKKAKEFNSLKYFTGLLKPAKSGLMSNTRIQCSGNKITITNVFNGSCVYEGEVPTPLDCDFLVNTKDLKEILKEGLQKLELIEDTLWINGIPIISKIPTNYPELPDFTGETIVLNADDLKKVVQCVSHNDSRRFIQGVLFDVDKVVATDGKRLAIHNVNVGFKNLIVKEEFIKAMPNGDVLFTKFDSRLKFKVGSVTVFSNELEATFPPYNAVIPKEDMYKEFKMPVIDDKKFKTLLDKDTPKVIFRKNTLVVGKYTEEIPEFAENEIDIAINWDFLKDAMVNCDRILFKNNQSTIILKGENHYEVLMHMTL